VILVVESFDEDNDFYTGPPLDEDMLGRAEETLGVRLPRTYVEVLFHRNGGLLKRRCCPTEFPTSWAASHFEILALLGIGGDWGIDAPLGSTYLISEWDYPEIGIVICAMRSCSTTPSLGLRENLLLPASTRTVFPDG